MRTQLRKLYDRGGMRVVAVLAVVMGLSLAWVPGAQAAGNVTVSVEHSLDI